MPPARLAPESDLYGPRLREASRVGARLFINHVGLSRHGEGRDQRAVRTGLCPGSSDLIGWTADGRFCAVEVKRPGWRPTPSWRASQQAAFIAAVAAAGGVAGIATSVEDLRGLLGGPAE